MSDELAAFRQEVREWVCANLPPEMAERTRRLGYGRDEDGVAWTRLLAAKGWSVSNWPVEHGGTGWSALQEFVFRDECARAGAPEPNWQALFMVGPVIMAFGSQQQKRRFLEPIRRGEQLWAQGFSEPNAGSDLASLRTRAVREGDHYVVSGQKIWTSGAYHSDWGFFVVRTNPDVKPQAGLSFLLVDLKSPGLTIRRIPQMNGDAHLCEVFLDNVRVPVENLVGEPDKGWTYSKYLLDHERTASSFIYWNKAELARTWAMARTLQRNGRPLSEMAGIRERLLRLESEVNALEWSVLRVLAGERSPWPASAAASALKVRGSLLQQAVTGLQVDLMGQRALRAFDYEQMAEGSIPASSAWPQEVQGRTAAYLYSRASTIYGGALQVQKNILSKLVFGF